MFNVLKMTCLLEVKSMDVHNYLWTSKVNMFNLKTKKYGFIGHLLQKCSRMPSALRKELQGKILSRTGDGLILT